MDFNIFNYRSVRSFLHQLLTEDKFKKILPPDYIKNRYYLDNKYAFYLGIDAIIKFDQIIDDKSLIKDYVEELNRVFRKFNDYNKIINGINLEIAKVAGIKLALPNTYTFTSRKRILSYIYNRYIVNGYFYFGFSSNYLNEIECLGIHSKTFFIDDKLKYINDIFKDNSGKLLFLNNETTITDDSIVASYFAFLAPYFLSDMAVNPLFIKKDINRESFYTHDIIKIKDNLIKVCDNVRLNNENEKEVVNTFIDCYTLCCRKEIKPCIAKIKRASIGKNKLKDIDYIINNTDLKLTSAVGLILDSRYNSYRISNSISPYDIEFMELPMYQDLLLGNTNSSSIYNTISINSEDLKISTNRVRKNMTSNSYGAVSVAFVGLLFIFVGTILAIFISFFGG